jgi:hypothetical protein
VDSWPDFGALPEASDHAGASLSGLLSDPDHGHGGFRAVFDRAHRRREDFLERLDAYEEILAEWSTAAVAAATGRTLDRPVGGSERDLEVAAALMFAPQAGSAGPWPDRWIDAHYFARTVLKQADYLVGAERSAGLRDAAADWLARSLDRPLTAEMEAGERRRFRDWVTSIRWPEDVRPIGGSVARPVIAAAAAAIRAWAGDRALAALIPPEVYAAMKTEFDGSAYWGPCYSHMLGHGPSAQEPLPVDDPTLCLLNLASEPALGWMFGDVGNATFWISPQDLARRDFSKVRAAVQGN